MSMQGYAQMFLSSGVEFVRADDAIGVSKNTREALSNGNFDFIGKVKRVTPYKDKKIVNNYFKMYLEENNIALPSGYKYASANVSAELPSVAKYDKFQPQPDSFAMKLSKQWMYRHFQDYMFASEKISSSEALSAMDKTTSPGYPWSLKWPSKRDMIASIKIDGLFKLYWDDLTSGVESKYTPIWTSSVKAEMRPDEKVDANKLRTFCASPVEHSVALNQVCADMNNRFYSAGAYGLVWSKVGISKFNRGWNRVAQRLKRHPNGFNLDMKEWDSSEFREFMLDIAEFRAQCLENTATSSDSDREVMYKLYNSIINTVMVLSNGDIVQKSTGMPSGSANTVVDNTLNLFRILAYTYIRACVHLPDEERAHFMRYEVFMRECEAALYGDDNTLTVSDKIVKWFNAKVIAHYALECGMTVTSENDEWDPKPIEQLTFLSHKFVKESPQMNFYVPVPDGNKVLCSLLYGSRTDDPRWHVMRALALRVECFYDTVARRIIDGYVNWMFRKHSNVLHDGLVANGVTWQQIRGMRHTNDEIEMLYKSEESNCVLAEGSNNHARLPLNFLLTSSSLFL